MSLACAPTDTSEHERDLLSKALLRAGTFRVTIIPEVWAAAIGVGLDVMSPCAQAVIDIGEGVTDMAIIQGGRLSYFTAVRTACSDLQKVIRASVMAKHKVYLYKEEIEKLLNEIVPFYHDNSLLKKFVPIEGIHIQKKCKVKIDLNIIDFKSYLEKVINKILVIIRQFFERLPERSFGDVAQLGIYLTGGGACIKGIDTLIALETNLDVKIASDPIHSVINGAVKILNYYKEMENILGQTSWSSITGRR
jgi:rod shape-determining protein MreB